MKSILTSLINAFTATTKLAEDEIYVLTFAAEIISAKKKQSEKAYYLTFHTDSDLYILTVVSAEGVRVATLSEDEVIEAVTYGSNFKIMQADYSIYQAYIYDKQYYEDLYEIPFFDEDLDLIERFAEKKNILQVCS